ncbi:cyclin-dependent kinase 11B-like [Spodoptera litura]|uniref:Cyclin-dependent kinase 11B-like n=1 Tax=Spodoptera litura TaxID=69820 RepID=A0A9J7IQI9_SPOLT|nr:cyclin-dependent kinase 11B-like [Spodoptera litura]
MSNKGTGHQLKENGNSGISRENRDRIKNSRTEGRRNTSEVKNHLKGVTKSKTSNGKMTNAVPKVNHKCRTTNANSNPLLLFPSGERLKELDMAYEGAMDLLRILDEDGVNRRKGRSKRKTDMQNEVDMAYEGAMQLIANESNSHIASHVGNAGPSNGGAEVGRSWQQQRQHRLDKLSLVDEMAPEYQPFQSCRSVDEFQYLYRIDEGSFGTIHGAKDRRTGELVALKQLKKINETEGFSIAARRELGILLKMRHPNIVAGRGIASSSGNEHVFIVMELVDYDLKTFMETMKENKQMFSVEHVKCLMTQLLSAVQHLHNHHMIHRDLKTHNILLSNEGVLKVADFGMAREYEFSPRQYTPDVVTRWYRAPELLLLSKEYSATVDMWSVGCIFDELITLRPLFPGRCELDQIIKIFVDLGTPSDTIWPGYSALPMVRNIVFNDYPPGGLRKKISRNLLSEDGLYLLQDLLIYDPAKRTTAAAALEHPYFKEQPEAMEPAMFLKSPAR